MGFPASLWTSLTCLLFIFSLLTTITAKPTINEIGTKVISKDAINVMCPPIICTLYCPWGFEVIGSTQKLFNTMKIRCDFYNSGVTYAVVWLSLTYLLFILSLATIITAKPTINEIDTSMTSKNATNETCPPIMCPIMICRWGFSHETDEVTGCQTCKCWDPCSNIECPKNKICVLQMRACFTTPCPPLTTCENIMSSSTF